MNLTLSAIPSISADTQPPLEQASYSGIFITLCVVLLVAAVIAAVVALAPRAKNSDLVPPRSSSPTNPANSNRKSGRSPR